MTTDDLFTLFPNASADFRARNPQLREFEERQGREEICAPAVRPKLERRASTPAVGKTKPKAPDRRRFLVRVTSRRLRLIDEDNLCEKFVVDCCRHAGLLPDDGPRQTKIEVRQEEVGKEVPEETLIEIYTV